MKKYLLIITMVFPLMFSPVSARATDAGTIVGAVATVVPVLGIILDLLGIDTEEQFEEDAVINEDELAAELGMEETGLEGVEGMTQEEIDAMIESILAANGISTDSSTSDDEDGTSTTDDDSASTTDDDSSSTSSSTSDDDTTTSSSGSGSYGGSGSGSSGGYGSSGYSYSGGSGSYGGSGGGSGSGSSYDGADSPCAQGSSLSQGGSGEWYQKSETKLDPSILRAGSNEFNDSYVDGQSEYCLDMDGNVVQQDFSDEEGEE